MVRLLDDGQILSELESGCPPSATELAVGRCSLRPKLGAQAAIFVDEAGFDIASETLKCGRFSILLNAAHCLFVGF